MFKPFQNKRSKNKREAFENPVEALNFKNAICNLSETKWKFFYCRFASGVMCDPRAVPKV